MPVPRLLVAVGTTLATALVLGPAAIGATSATGATGAAHAAVTGSDSGGDPYFPLDGNGGYQVEHYTIRDDYRPGSDRLTGSTVLEARATADLSAFHLDLALTADSVRVDGVAARFSKPNRHELRVVPATAVTAGDPFRVVVRYHGRPASVVAAGQSPFSWTRGEGVAVGQPQMGPWWFAANETPADKATYDIVLRVPRGQEALSNGELVSREPVGDWTRWTWRMSQPMATYLAFFAAGQFRVEQTTAAGRPVVYGVSEKLGGTARAEAMALMRRTPGVVSWLESEFGPYPFTSTGGVVVGAPLGYLLETQSRPVYPYIGGTTARNVSLVVHEQAHQWFGDDVAVTRWRDIWLNEGFATYAEWAWSEHLGSRTVSERLRLAYDGRPRNAPFWGLKVSDPGPARMFDDVIYQRGAMTLAALRQRVGDATFDAVARAWVTRNARGHGTDAEFRALAEELSGEELSAFFAEWLDDTDRPADTEENGLP
ncbi:M1 family metallopeptidase [Nocardioides sp. HDW12B]|uniref:M1 family metallopeptidase n=1 Tax=Nocardioides sp. HDW12B TaxID=2714939 RepID=UPI00140D8F27|nr:M1 family metallopeptidase [Nocardioides sp. HDW12B]QIK66962.1 M1 family metallopeptidase [Nocardioides sp. HDW12B]